jgi:hypothetical protein
LTDSCFYLLNLTLSFREWLTEQVCGGYITYDSKTDKYSYQKNMQ